VARGPAPKPLKLVRVAADDAGRVTMAKWTEPDTREGA